MPTPVSPLPGGAEMTFHPKGLMADAAMIDSPTIVKLLRAAVDEADSPFSSTGRVRTVIKSVSARQRARRPEL